MSAISPVRVHDPYVSSHYIHHTSYLALSRVGSQEYIPLTIHVSLILLRYLVGTATLFMSLGSHGGTGGFLLS